MQLSPARRDDNCLLHYEASALHDASSYEFRGTACGIEFDITPGSLTAFNWLTADFLLDGKHLAVFAVELYEVDSLRRFRFQFGLLNRCQARLRLPLSATNQNRWLFGREGACLKMMAGGDRVDLSRVHRMRLVLVRKAPGSVRVALTPPVLTSDDPAQLRSPLLPDGPLLDALGQSCLHDWAEKTRSEDELASRLRAQAEQADLARWPDGFSPFGGDARADAPRLDASGFFRTHHDGQRWWLIDPQGYRFFSTGLDCLEPRVQTAYARLERALQRLPAPHEAPEAFTSPRPNTVDFLKLNFRGVFGAGWKDTWNRIALSMLRRWGFNTIGNWSDWRMARAAGFPYVRPLAAPESTTSLIYRDFPDVFDPRFADDADRFGRQLAETADDPAFIGYFLMNEPTWGFAQESPGEGMLYTCESAHTRAELARWLHARYADDARLAAAWGMPVSFEQTTRGRFTQPLSDAARADLRSFSSIMVERFFGTLSAACRRADPHHLNLGVRYHTTPPAWALGGMRSFDVFSMNCYRQRVPADVLATIERELHLPVMIGEWHFGALDVGLPASGIGHVPDQRSRGDAYRVYLENAAALPQCVGVHYFTLYDQSALGRFDGENYNIGFLDVCNRPYDALCDAARASHQRMYSVAAGAEPPFDVPVVHLPMLFG